MKNLKTYEQFNSEELIKESTVDKIKKVVSLKGIKLSDKELNDAIDTIKDAINKIKGFKPEGLKFTTNKEIFKEKGYEDLGVKLGNMYVGYNPEAKGTGFVK